MKLLQPLGGWLGIRVYEERDFIECRGVLMYLRVWNWREAVGFKDDVRLLRVLVDKYILVNKNEVMRTIKKGQGVKNDK